MALNALVHKKNHTRRNIITLRLQRQILVREPMATFIT